MRIELTRAILMSWLSNILRNSSIHFRMFLYLETCFIRVTVSLLCRLQDVSMTHVSIYHNLFSEWRRNCSTTATKPWISGNMLPNINDGNMFQYIPNIYWNLPTDGTAAVTRTAILELTHWRYCSSDEDCNIGTYPLAALQQWRGLQYWNLPTDGTAAVTRTAVLELTHWRHCSSDEDCSIGTCPLTALQQWRGQPGDNILIELQL